MTINNEEIKFKKNHNTDNYNYYNSDTINCLGSFESYDSIRDIETEMN